MDVLVASLADNQCLATARCHPLDPERFVTLAWSVQISQPANVVDLERSFLRFTQLAFLSQKTLPGVAPSRQTGPVGQGRCWIGRD